MLQPPSLPESFPGTMSGECEAVAHQAAPPLPATTASAPGPSHSSAAISYEGRVSVIPPLAGYQATMRAALELDRVHGHPPPAATNAHRQYGSHLEQDLRRLYQERAMRQVYLPEDFKTKDEGTSGGQPQGEVREATTANHSPSPSRHSPHSPAPPHMEVKCEPQEGEQDAALAHAHHRPQVNLESSASPINKAGESPDLPTDSARTQASSDEQKNVYQSLDPEYKQSTSERMSPVFEEAYHGGEERMSMEEGDDTMDSSMMMGDTDMDHLSRLQQAMELSGVMSGKDDEGGDKPQVFQCHLCSYSGTSRFHFNAHLNTHYDHKCAKCEFTAHTEPKLREHMQEEHGLSPDSTEDLEAIRVPRVNAQGKVKTFKCKQCEYVAITKGDFWEHARSHIKSEKLLTCPKCPFVTEYKHHLEYHLRNHFGSKPFKCSKCNYSCVNKSMLNSHMKSHSNIYQYRCSDCTYATKYCHSLKLHLRKYGHQPAMVLNPDGTPNPIPIIDVYGTRRGPKMKKDEKGMPILPPHYQIQAQLLKAQMQVSGKVPLAPASPLENSPKHPTAVPPAPMPPTSLAGHPHSLLPHYPYPNMMETVQTSSPILSRALEKSPEELARPHEGREQLRELLLERERTALKNSLSPSELIRCKLCDFATESREMFSHHMMNHAACERREDPEDVPRSPLPMDRSGSPGRRSLSPVRPHLFPQHPPPPLISTESHLYSPLAVANNLKEYLARTMNPFIYQQMVGGQLHPAFGLQQQLPCFPHPAFQGPRPLAPEEDTQPPLSPPPQQIQPISPNTEGVLDLSKEQNPLQQMSVVKEQTPPQQVRDTSKEPPPLPQRTESRSSISPNHSSPQSSSPPRSETSTPPSKNRRKGRAFKLERIALRLSESAEGESSGHDDDSRREEEDGQRKTQEGLLPSLMPLTQADGQQDLSEEWQSAHQCQYCDMAFKDVVMYTMHMGYHGYHNPFTCNMCGHQAADKVAFFLHIARSSHS